ncbi:MAG: aspartate aminotransferase family protein [Acidobacteria bacterium]|nr:aspartate aminotransferase family protein [Acidobacteriota bacterium]
MPSVDRARLGEARAAEERLFVERHPRSAELVSTAREHLVSGVPMPWMVRWPGAFPIVVDRAEGSRFTDVDGVEYVDFCLGDTGAMTGHASGAVASALAAQSRKGLTTMLPSPDAGIVAANLAGRFGLPKWQFCLSATDANRFVLRFARHLQGRPKVVVHDWCYHGTVDETLVVLDAAGRTVSRPGAVGPQVDPSLTTRAVPFNDLAALEVALAHGDVAVMLIEPALTNIGIVLPEDGYLEGVRELTRRHDVLLAIDETHTICAGPGGCTARWGLEPDFLVIGKTIGGGVPVAAYGMSAAVADRIEASLGADDIDVSGVGGTLAGSALALSAMRATLESSLTAAQFDVAEPLAERWTEGVAGVVAAQGLDWHVQRLGCRAEYWFSAPPRSGAQAAAAVDHELEAFLHLWALNRGVLLTPFHNMALMSPMHTIADVDRHTEVFAAAIAAIVR